MTTYRVTLYDPLTDEIATVYEQHGAVQFVAGVAYVDDATDAGFLAALQGDIARRGASTWRLRIVIEEAERPEGWPPAVARTNVGRPLGPRLFPVWFGSPLQDAADPDADPEQRC